MVKPVETRANPLVALHYFGEGCFGNARALPAAFCSLTMQLRMYAKTLFQAFLLYLGMYPVTIFAQAKADTLTNTSLSEPSSSFSAQLQYQSQVIAAGRNFGEEQFGIFPYFDYFHKSGVYISYSGSLFSEPELNYELSVFSLGYQSNFGNHFFLDLYYSRFVFHPLEDGLMDNGFGISLGGTLGAWQTGLQFSVYLGEEVGYHLSPYVGGYWWLSLGGWMDGMSISARTDLAFGTENAPFAVLPLGQFERSFGRPWSDRRFIRSASGVGSSRAASPETTFGLMAWNVSLPVTFYHGAFGLQLTANYVRPVVLDNEIVIEPLSDQFFWAVGLLADF